jgi:hypothetical protein
LPSNEDFGRLPDGKKVSRDGKLPAMGEGFSDPGLFDKWRWRKRNVDGGVLASLDYLKT